jgi:hypothetical protein
MPFAAQAHTGHHHHAQPGHVSSHVPKQTVTPDAAESRISSAPQSVSAHVSVPDHPAMDSECKDRGCCNTGHCTSGAAIVAPMFDDAWPPLGNLAFGRRMAPAVTSAPADRLRRPPRSQS